MTKSEAGRIGGLRTLERYGREGMAERGRRGGRPRAPTIDDIRRQSVSVQSIGKGGLDTPGSLTELKRAWRTRRSTENTISNEGAG